MEIHDWTGVKILSIKHRFQNIEMQRKQQYCVCSTLCSSIVSRNPFLCDPLITIIPGLILMN